jgi:hypothetical protein
VLPPNTRSGLPQCLLSITDHRSPLITDRFASQEVWNSSLDNTLF